MKTINSLLISFLFCAFISFSNNINAQCSNSEWVKTGTFSPSGSAVGEGMAVCNDSFGNAFITGIYFLAPVTFGAFTLPNVGGEDIYVVKYDSTGAVIWAKSAGSADNEETRSICADNFGNVYVTGIFLGTIITFGSYTLTNNGFANIFIVKYDPFGNVVWAKSAGSTAGDIVHSISTDHIGNLFIAGSFCSPTIIFGADTLISADTSFLYCGDSFITKYDLSGNVLWAKSAKGSNSDEAWAVSANSSGDAYLTGHFYSKSITFGGITIYNSDTSQRTPNLFITKYNSAGIAQWAKSVVDTSSQLGSFVNEDVFGNVYVAGKFIAPSLSFGSFTLTNTDISGGSTDMFLAKYDPLGNTVWARSGGGNSNDDVGSVFSDLQGNIYVTGGFYSPSLTFDSLSIIPPPPPPGQYDPMFILKYDSSGTILCGSYLNSGGDDNNQLSVDNVGNIYITGDFLTQPFIFGTDTIYSTGIEDIFLAKIGKEGSTGITESNKKNEIVVFPNPSYGPVNFNGMKKETTIEIFDVIGRLTYKTSSKNEKSTIDLNFLAKGMYFYRLTSLSGECEQGKIMLK